MENNLWLLLRKNQSLLNICDNVIHIFKAYGKADKILRDTGSKLLFIGKLLMCC